jgi:hypothetical protein
MAGIDDVLERLVTDAEFARSLARDPAAALAGYDLTQDDVSLLSTQVSFDPGALSLVEERISKSSMFGLLTSITGGLAVGTSPPEPDLQLGPSPHMSPGVVAPIDSQGLVDPGDMGDPSGAGETFFKEVDPAPQGAEGGFGGGGGAGSDVFFKEVEPGVPPDLGGGGGGGGDEVAFKEVEPGVPPDLGGGGGGGTDSEGTEVGEYEEVADTESEGGRPGGTQGIIIDTSVDNPDYQPAASGDGSVRDPASLVGFNPQPDPPGVTAPGD